MHNPDKQLLVFTPAAGCRKCYEVKCVNRNFKDGYGKSVSRMDACSDESESVVVKVVDRCAPMVQGSARLCHSYLAGCPVGQYILCNSVLA